MPYPESFIGPMRQELTRHGVRELKTADEVDALVRGASGHRHGGRQLDVRLRRRQGPPRHRAGAEASGEARRRGDGIRRRRHRSDRARPQLLHRLPAIVAVHRDPPGRQAGRT